MMKYALTLFVLAVSFLSSAQLYNVISAETEKGSGDLTKAKELIDKALLHEETKNHHKMWKVRGDIYYDLALKSRGEDQAILLEAIESYENCIREKSTYKTQIGGRLQQLGDLALSQGVNNFNSKDFKQAYLFFSKADDARSVLGEVDTLAVYNMALSSERLGNNKDAVRLYERLIALNYRSEKIYGFILHLHKAMGDNSAYKNTLIQVRKKYPQNIDFLFSDINLSLADGDMDRAVSLLNQAIQLDPSNPMLYYIIGTVYDAKKMFDKAEASYEKAIQIKPDYFEAHYNLGALYFNQGVEANNAMNDIVDPDQYLAQKKKVDDLFNKAIGPLEKAREINPSDINTLQSLKQLYARVGDTEKYTEVKEALEN